MKIKIILALLLLTGVLGAQTPPNGRTPGATVPVTDEAALTITDGGAPALPGQPALQTGGGDVGIWDFVRMFLILIIVVGLVYAFLYFMKKAGKIGTTSLEGVKILGSQVLSGNRVLYVVEVAGDVLLLGAGDGSISLLKEITDPEVRDTLRLQSSQQQDTPITGFSQFLQKFMKSSKNEGISQNSGKTSVDFLKKQRERLKKM